jgi:hypothetical protein
MVSRAGEKTDSLCQIKVTLLKLEPAGLRFEQNQPGATRVAQVRTTHSPRSTQTHVAGSSHRFSFIAHNDQLHRRRTASVDRRLDFDVDQVCDRFDDLLERSRIECSHARRRKCTSILCARRPYHRAES